MLSAPTGAKTCCTADVVHPSLPFFREERQPPVVVSTSCVASEVTFGIYEWSAVAQLVECRTRNRESPGSNPVVTVSKFGHFLSLHDASVDSAV